MNHDQSVWSDTQAVSPVMATFVLILVGIIGAAGVAEMISGFASDVADSSSAEEIEAEATIEIVVAGCEVVEPITEEIAVAYMAAYPGIRVAVQGGGSHAGVVSVGLDAVNIGAVSRGVTDDEREDYPDNGVPGVLEGGFIKFSQSPAAAGCFDGCGCFSAAMIGGYND